ncbi:MAG: hypothetical protein NTV86_05480 [Planctomycetota bacterium]|nr:hypothetical protein [Planctomycetota bacterium]
MEELEPRLFLSAVVKASPGFQFYHPDSTVAPAAGYASPSGLSPATMRHAYAMDAISFGGIVGDGTGQTIAIVDAYNAPNIVADLAAFDAYWTAAGFPLQDPPSFTVIGQTLGAPLPDDPPNKGDSWAIETSLDVEWAHVMAPNASILLVEANSPSFTDLLTAVDTARNYPGVCVVSMSWSADEFRGETGYDYHFTTPSGHTGVTFVASTGDYGAYSYHTSSLTVEYPAASANVLAVGGTTLTTGAGGTWVAETGWGNGTSSGTLGGSGGGISRYVNKPSYQNDVVTQSTKRRCIPDIAMDADPNTGVPVYDSWDFGVSTPWNQFGGTSLSAPLWAGLISIVDQGRVLSGRTNLDGPSQTLPAIYALPSQNLHDVTSGNNGYAAGTGYDLVTGRGTPVANLLAPAMVGPALSPPTIGALTITPGSLMPGEPVTLTAVNVQESPGTITGVAFYRETNGIAGLQTGSDTYVGPGARSSSNWSLSLNSVALPTGIYTFYALATDSTNTTATASAPLTVSPIVVTVNPLVTNDHSPGLTGTVNSPTAAVHVTIGLDTWLAINNGDGTWTLPGGTVLPDLATGLYDVQAVADDAYGDHVSDATTDELIVYTIPGDFNLDNEAGPEDFGILKDNFGLQGGYLQGDANGDGEIGPEDFAILKDNFGLDA